MKLLVGLGNPGTEHARNRHNIGFMAVDAIVARHGLGPMRKRFRGLSCEGRLGGERVLVLKPQTYMNRSGDAVGDAARFYKIEPGEIIVLHDEIDLAAGKVRVKLGGGVAGHNGLRSIAAHLGPDFVRVRIGIGHPGSKHKVHRHVLGDFAKSDAEWVEPLIDAIAANAERLIAGDHANFMNEVARAVQPEAGGGDGSAKADRDKPRPAARGRQSKAPSQRDLARAAAETRSAPATGAPRTSTPDPETPEDETPEPDRGPFARLRRLFAAPGRKP